MITVICKLYIRENYIGISGSESTILWLFIFRVLIQSQEKTTSAALDENISDYSTTITLIMLWIISLENKVNKYIYSFKHIFPISAKAITYMTLFLVDPSQTL